MIIYKKAKPSNCSLCGKPLGESHHRMGLGKGFYIRLHADCYKTLRATSIPQELISKIEKKEITEEGEIKT